MDFEENEMDLVSIKIEPDDENVGKEIVDPNNDDTFLEIKIEEGNDSLDLDGYRGEIKAEWNVGNDSHGTFVNESSLVEVKCEEKAFDFNDIDDENISNKEIGFLTDTFMELKSEDEKVLCFENTEKQSCEISSNTQYDENLMRIARSIVQNEEDRRKDVNDSPSSFKCQACGVCYTTKEFLDQHSQVHGQIKKFECEVCGKLFTRKGNLKVHLRIHTGEKLFECQECGKRLTSSSNFKIHQRSHNGIKPFKCQECGKRFTSHGNLKQHQTVRTGIKPFKCEECGKKFFTKRYLIEHRRIHTGVKPFKCEECGKKFNTKRYLTEHRRIHTGIKLFNCEECGKKFNLKRYMTRHRKMHTRVKPIVQNVVNHFRKSIT